MPVHVDADVRRLDQQEFGRLLGHTTLDGLHWINVTGDCVALTTIEK